MHIKHTYPSLRWLVCALLIPLCAVALADDVDPNTVLLNETFSNTTGKGGRDGEYSGNIANNNVNFDADGWTMSGSTGGASSCIKLGSTSATGSCTTPALTLLSAVSTATLTFQAAGWGSGTNTLTVTATGATVTGQTSVTVTNSTWNTYSVNISPSSDEITVTFTGKRVFLDDIKIIEEATSIPAPTLSDGFTFWPNTTETPSRMVTVSPAERTTVRYTTDGTEPDINTGTKATQPAQIEINTTTTIKAIAYFGSTVSSVVSRTYTLGTTVGSIAEMLALADGTEARLFLSDAQNARVLHVDDAQCYLRDASGAIRLDLATASAFNPQPAHNQHVAGWIIGRRQTQNGVPTLVATERTTTRYLAFAAPVTESATAPLAISADDYSSHLADWVTIGNLRIANDGVDVEATGGSTTITVDNKYSLDASEGYTSLYDGALADVSGIAISDGTNNVVYPVYYEGAQRPVVYVIDEQKAFVSPVSDISDATVRLQRTLSSSQWNTLSLPFDVAIDGELREYASTDGHVMHFRSAGSVEAGKPYLVKPASDVVNPTFGGVTLSSTAAQAVGSTDYSFVAAYSPTALATDGTERFLTNSGSLGYSSNPSKATIRGMWAYFRLADAGQDASIFIADDGFTTTMRSAERNSVAVEGDGVVYDLSGRRVDSRSKGVRIVRRPSDSNGTGSVMKIINR